MHELSIIQHIIDIANEELCIQGAGRKVESVDLEIGELAGVEIDSLEFLWSAAISETPLEGAACQIHRIPGTAFCTSCEITFPIKNVFDPCPKCNAHWIHIRGGEELRIKSITMLNK